MCVRIQNDRSRKNPLRNRKGRNSNSRVSLLRPPAGNELLYRSRDGDVIKYNAETEEEAILVQNKKFVSISSLRLRFPTGPRSQPATGPE